MRTRLFERAARRLLLRPDRADRKTLRPSERTHKNPGEQFTLLLAHGTTEDGDREFRLLERNRFTVFLATRYARAAIVRSDRLYKDGRR